MKQTRTYNLADGGLLIDKPTGFTSHDVVAVLRKRFSIKKIGHCGTLDPSATGLLILVLGKATKMSERLMGEDKIYEGAMRFGETTSSYDADGQIIASSPLPHLTVKTLNEEAKTFTGDILQTPPMVSAIKIDGVPLYKLARKGLEVERKPRLIHIYNFIFTDYTSPDATFRIHCTKGTYVRSLAHDLGQKIGCGAHLARLRRTAIGRFNINAALPLDEILKFSFQELEQRVLPVHQLTMN